MRAWIFYVAAPLALLAGCLSRPPYDDLVGQGRLDLSPGAWAHFQKYRAEHDPGYFVVNRVKRYVLFNYCPDTQPCAQTDRIYDAINACESRSGGKCEIMATEGRLVWRGDIYVGGRRVENANSLAAGRSAPQRLDAIYRLSKGDAVGAWLEGTIEIATGDAASRFTATFADGMVCAGEIKSAGRAAGRPIEGTVKGQCAGGADAVSELAFVGGFKSERPYEGHMTGVDSHGRAVDLIYRPGRRR